jgi:2'-5' RNA ligase
MGRQPADASTPDRLFVALWPCPEAVADLAGALGADRPVHPALRWQPPERWHSTLAFLGPADPARATARIDRIPLAPARPIRLAGTGTFGPVLWIGVQHDGWLADLAQSVQQALRVVEGPYHPHVTIARGRGPEATTAAHGAAHALAGYRGPPWLPPAVTLVRSRTGPRPLYEVLSTWPLSPG